jgi:hypothetical protein
MSMQRLYLSFWDISLSNFPAGKFHKRELTGVEAKARIDSHLRSGSLLCVSKDDLNAPYNTREKSKHDDLRAALLSAHGIDLTFEQFNTEDTDGDQPCHHITPLELASISGASSLLVVTCSYTLDTQSKNDAGSPAFSIASDSIEFHLFEG